ncbi:MAG TPA: PH domain-containing protein [Longimicrobiales bacterium]|nr:PH domain-containing protein [Longimicrobiales bacterium]
MTLADGETHPLDPRWIPYRRRVAGARSAVYALMLLAGAAAAVVVSDAPAFPVWAAAVVLATGLACVSLWWPAVAYRHSSYRLSTRALEIRRGVLWRSIVDVPRSRIQHSDVSQGPFERLHGLGTLSVYTAGTRHALVRLRGLNHQRALAIREHLLQADDADVI